MYFALSALIAAGLLGLQSGETHFPQLDVPHNPALLDEQTRAQYGIVQPLPRDLDEALAALERDGALMEALAQGWVADYVKMKEAEMEILGEMGEVERRVFLIERY